MTSPMLPSNSGVLSRYITSDDPIGTEVFRLEDLRAALRPAVAVPAGAPPLPAPMGAPAAAPAAPIAVDALTDEVLGRLDGNVQRLGAKVGAGYQYAEGQAPVQAYDFTWCKRRAPRAEIVKAYNLYQRMRVSGAQGNPKLRALPNISANRIAGDKMVPYPPRAADASFPYWLNEVYAETGNTNARELALRILQDGVAVRPADQLGDDEKVDAMRVLIKETFLEMAPTELGDRVGLLPQLGINIELHNELGLAYHGTGRGPDDVAAQGTARLLDIPGREATLGTGNRWHPYSAEHWVGRPLYYRRGSEDNDLPSTVSIAQSPVASLDFPLVQGILNDTPAFHAGGRALADGDYQTTGGYRFSVVGGRHVTHAWVYLVGVEAIFPTARLQGANHFSSGSSEHRVLGLFAHHGELATRRIKPGHHIVGVKYERVHFGPEREQGMRYRAVEVVNLAGRPGRPSGGHSVYEQVYARLLVMFPLCGVKQANQPVDAYRAHLDEAIATYQGGPPETLLTRLESDAYTLANQLANGQLTDPAELAHAKAMRTMLTQTTGSVFDAWKVSVQNMRDERNRV